MRRKIAVLLAATFGLAGTAKADLVTWDYSGIVKYSSESSIQDGIAISGQVTYDTATPGSFYNASASAQYDGAVTAMSISIPQLSIAYTMSAGPADFQIQDHSQGNYEAALYGNSAIGSTFSGSGLPSGISGLELFFNSFTDFLTPAGGTALPADPYSLGLIPYTWDQNGQGATFEFYPGADGYVRGQITSVSKAAAAAVPEPGSLVILAVGLSLLWPMTRGTRQSQFRWATGG